MDSVKKIPCSKCNGRGIIAHSFENGISCESCRECHGEGYHFAPVTIADNIRSMNDKDLASELLNYFSNGYDTNGRCDFNKVYDEILERLQQPINENWREELVKPVSRL